MDNYTNFNERVVKRFFANARRKKHIDTHLAASSPDDYENRIRVTINYDGNDEQVTYDYSSLAHCIVIANEYGENVRRGYEDIRDCINDTMYVNRPIASIRMEYHSTDFILRCCEETEYEISRIK